jgi:hypothetical protein
MNSNLKRALQSKMAVLTILAVFVQILGFGWSLPVRAQDAVNPGQTPDARIIVPGNKIVNVDGKKALPNQPVASGSTIETFSETGAEVQIERLGNLKIFPKTKLRITYSATEVLVTILEGCASLFMEPTFSGLIRTPKGDELRANDPVRIAQVNSCDAAAILPPRGSTVAGISTPWFIAGVLGIIGLGVFIANYKPRDCNNIVSTSDPRFLECNDN